MNQSAAITNRRPDLDGLRGFACLSVILLHVVVGPTQFTPGSLMDDIRFALQPFMVGGVDLFFVLSGFLIGGILIDNKGASNFFRTFWIRRVSRIFPVYYLMILILLVLYAAQAVQSTDYLKGMLHAQMPLWTYATFTQNFYMIFSDTGYFGNFMGITWTLAMEEQFYLLLPFLIYFFPQRKVIFFAVALILIAPFVRTFLWEVYNWKATYHLTPARMDTVMWGVLIASVVRNDLVMKKLETHKMSVSITIILLALLIATDSFGALSKPLLTYPSTHHTTGLFVSTLRYSALAMMYGLIVLRLYIPGATGMKSFFSNKTLAQVGLVSYSAYMYHQFINMSVHNLLRGQSPALTSWDQFYIPISILFLTFLAAAISYRYMEKPILARARKVKYIHD